MTKGEGGSQEGIAGEQAETDALRARIEAARRESERAYSTTRAMIAASKALLARICEREREREWQQQQGYFPSATDILKVRRYLAALEADADAGADPR